MAMTHEALILDREVSKVEKRSDGRRREARPVNRTMFHVTHFLLGTTVGSTVGIYSFVLARQLFGGTSRVLPHLWWLTMLVTLATLAVIKSQMDTIRHTVFVRRIKGQIRQHRVRRRHEVVMTVGRRALLAAFVAVGLVALLHYGIQHYRTELGSLGSFARTSGLPRVGDDVLLALFSLAVAALTLMCCELTLRATQKEGFPHQALWLFFPASLASGLSMLHLASLLT